MQISSTRLLETVTGLVVLVVAIVFLTFGLTRTQDGKTAARYEVIAEFDDASGITRGTPVRLSGVEIGQVRGHELDPKTFVASVRLAIDERIRLPVDTSARVIPEGLLGGNYVSLTPGGSFETIPEGGTIQYTQGAVNLVDLLGRFIFSSAETGGGGAP